MKKTKSKKSKKSIVYNQKKKSIKIHNTQNIKNHNTLKYDVIIVGGGISGLYTTYNILKKYKNKKILLLESTNRLGGRISSITDKETKSVFEGGAARFHNKQNRILKLIKELNLDDKIVPISNDIKFMSYPSDKYYEVPYLSKIIDINTIIKELAELKENGKISYEEMLNNSLLDLIHKKLNNKYPDIKNMLKKYMNIGLKLLL